MNINEKFDDMINLLGSKKQHSFWIAPSYDANWYESRIDIGTKSGNASMGFGAGSFRDLKIGMVEWFYGNEWDVKLKGV